MKNIFIILLLMLIPSSVIMAQYQNVQEKAPLMNTPLNLFVSQQKTLFNFDWKFQLVTEKNKNTDFASPTLNDSSWRTLDLPHDFQLNNPGRKLVVVPVALSLCVRDGTAKRSRQIHYGKENGW